MLHVATTVLSNSNVWSVGAYAPEYSSYEQLIYNCTCTYAYQSSVKYSYHLVHLYA